VERAARCRENISVTDPGESKPKGIGESGGQVAWYWDRSSGAEHEGVKDLGKRSGVGKRLSISVLQLKKNITGAESRRT